MALEMLKLKKKWIQLTDKDEINYFYVKISDENVNVIIGDLNLNFEEFYSQDGCFVLKMNGEINFILKVRNANSIYCAMINNKKIINQSVLY